MYLSKRVYIGADYEHREVKGTIEITAKGKPIPVKFERVSEIVERVGYWRKANHIHKWFVDNCQGGEDDCRDAYVSSSQLEELLDTCKKVRDNCPLVDGEVTNGYTFSSEGERIPIKEAGKVMTNQEFAHSLLPTQSGFFFGNDEYNQWYMHDIESTIEIIEDLFKDSEDGKTLSGDYYYRSSW